MTILCFALTVVVTNKTLNKKYPGGVEAYVAIAKSSGLDVCDDGEIVGIYFRSPLQVGDLISHLEENGFVYFEGDQADPGLQAEDLTVVDMLTGPVIKTPWLENLFDSGKRLAWLAGSAPTEPVIPDNFDLRDIEEAVFVANEEVLNSQGGMGPGVTFSLPSRTKPSRRTNWSLILLSVVAAYFLIRFVV